MELDDVVDDNEAPVELTRDEEAAALEAKPAESGAEESTAQTERTEEVVIGFDDDPAPDPEQNADTPVLRAVRQENRQLVRRIRELESRLKAPQEQAPEEVGPEPTLAEVDYDEDKFKQRMLEWTNRKIAADKRQQERQEQERKIQEAYQAKLDAYKRAAAELKVKDFEDAEAQAREVFSPIQQSILVKHMEQSAALVYALGRSPEKAKALAQITDPIEFALAAAKLQDKMKVSTTGKTAPPPERQIKGSGKTLAVTSANLESLRKKAQETGDYTEYLAAKRRMESRQT